jgi:pimeloyl-ACP methyl ester carboxylesterase
VAIISGGYGVGYSEYSFVANMLNDLNYTVVSIQNDLPTDPPLPSDGDLYALRMPIWTRGAENILFVRDVLERQHDNLDFTHLLLVGHSNGGDLSIVFANSHPELLSALVTLDNRRLPIPRSKLLRVLSLRSSDMPPIPGIVPTAKERAEFQIKIVQLSNAKHDQMYDGGSDATKRDIVNAVESFLLELK